MTTTENKPRKLKVTRDVIVSNNILSREEQFTEGQVYEVVREDIKPYFDSEAKAMQFVGAKVRALWEAGLLTYTGFSYYVNRGRDA